MMALALPRPAQADGANWPAVTATELADERPQLEPEAAAEILTCRLEITSSRLAGRQRSVWVR
jgi:hypothetical protein